MTTLVYDSLLTYFEDLAATNSICDSFGGCFTPSTNLFLGFEPDTDVDTVTLIPYGGSPPNLDNKRQNSSVQIRLKTNSREKALKVQQAIINELHTYQFPEVGKMTANQSAPILLKSLEGGEWFISVSNFNIKHLKL